MHALVVTRWQEKGVSYAEQGTFSLASWPFSLKLIWAPLVDALYVRRWGQRRTWVMPLQTAVGLLLLYMASHISELLGEHDVAVTPSVTPLTVIFFIIYFLLASQVRAASPLPYAPHVTLFAAQLEPIPVRASSASGACELGMTARAHYKLLEWDT
jgi:hypothetical protein